MSDPDAGKPNHEPDHGLDSRLVELETRQRAEMVEPGALCERALRVRIPASGSLPRSDALLERLYRDDLVPREKKPLVVDTRRCLGPFMASIDDDPLVVLDACSQIATLTHGFHNPRIVRALYDGRFDGCLWSNPDTTVEQRHEVSAYAAALRELAPPGLDHVALVMAGGAEANEKALRIARLHAPNGAARRRVMAFRHGFHGRTLAALMSTWNPKKRGPFELPDYEAVFAEPDLSSAEAVLRERGSEVYAVIIEPMMAEGGDRYLDREFLAGVRRLTRAHGIPLVVDEVQTGFATGGPFLWWQRLGLDSEANAPDLLTMAKKASLGVVLSRWPDPEPAPVHVAGVVRGHLHLEFASEQAVLEQQLQVRLDQLARDCPRAQNPRVAGTTFAFDLEDGEAVKAFIAQRFQRGFMTYQAGERTVRFRLNASFEPTVLDNLFGRIRTALALGSDASGLEWRPEGALDPSSPITVRDVEESDYPAIMAIQIETYEPARVTPESVLRESAARGFAQVAVDPASDEVMGFSFAGPLELFDYEDGPKQDPTLGTGHTLYSTDITVASRARGRGLGRSLKRAQLEWAKRAGFHYVTSRNRVGKTEAMMGLNRSFGGFPLARYRGVYGTETAGDYIRCPLGPPPVRSASDPEPRLDLASGIQRPFGSQPAGITARELVGPTASKLNLSNYATLDSVHYLEQLRLMLPRGMKHTYVTSSRDETVDKAIRCLRLSRTDAHIAIGFDGGYVGHTTAAARSLSDPRGFGPDLALFDWPRLPHPQHRGIEVTLSALERIIEQRGASALLGVFCEVVGERSGALLEHAAAEALAKACTTHDIPLVLVETTTANRRVGTATWGVDTLPDNVVADLVLWHPGGQLGHIFVGDRYYIETPLVLISTWDGDELSMIRAHEHLRAALRVAPGEASRALDELVRTLCAGIGEARAGGLALYRTLTLPDADAAARLHAACRARGLELGQGIPGTLLFVPPLDVDPEMLRGAALELASRAVEECFG